MAVQSGNQVSTTFADLPIVEEVALAAIELRMLETNAFVNSGVIMRDATLDNFLNGDVGGKTIAPRFIGPLTADEPNISSDNPAEKSTPKKVTGGESVAVRQSLNQSWSVMDLAAALMGRDPLGAVFNQIGDYWSAVITNRALASLRGIVADDLDGGAPVLTVDLSQESGAAALFNADAFIDAQATMGDRARDLTAIAMHSVVYATMQKQDLIEFIRNSQNDLLIPTYMGKRVIVDDAMTYVPASGSDTKPMYYSYLFGTGALAFGMGNPKVPIESARDAASGNGGGEEVLHSRYEFIIHPQGYSFGKQSTPTTAELIDKANWTRVFERKRIPLAALITQG